MNIDIIAIGRKLSKLNNIENKCILLKKPIVKGRLALVSSMNANAMPVMGCFLPIPPRSSVFSSTTLSNINRANLLMLSAKRYGTSSDEQSISGNKNVNTIYPT